MNNILKNSMSVATLMSMGTIIGINFASPASAVNLPSKTYTIDGTTITLKLDNTIANPVVQHISRNFTNKADCTSDLNKATQFIKNNKLHTIWKAHDECVYNTNGKNWSYGQISYSLIKKNNVPLKFSANDLLTSITIKTKYVNPNGTFMTAEQVNAMQKTYNFFKVFKFLI